MMAKLGEVCEFVSGGTPSRNVGRYFTGTTPWITGADVIDDKVAEPRYYITEEAIENSATNVIPAGNILLVTRTSVGKVAVNDYDICISQDFTGLIPDRQKIDIQYLYRYLQNQKNYFVQNQRGATIKGVTREVVENLEVPIPYPDEAARSLAEQRRIVARLEALLGEVRAMREDVGVMQEDLARVMESALGDAFSNKNLQTWENEQPLNNVVKVIASLVDPTLPEYRVLPHINGERIEEGTGKLLPYNTAEQDAMKSGKYLFQPGDVLYSKIRPYLRKVALVNFTGVCSADMYPLQVINGNLMPEFLKWTLLSRHFTEYAIELSRRARMPKVNRSQLFGYSLHYPSKPEQQRLVTYLENIQSETDGARKLLEEDVRAVEQLEQSILAAAFRGEV